MTVSASYTIPALDVYTISYNANGKTLTNTLPDRQDKTYGETVYVSSHIPETIGYTCTGWVTASPEYKFYNFGEAYTANTGAILYANWVANTYKVVYDANGGSSAPIEQVKTYDVELTLRSETPLRTNHYFLGWSTSPDSSSVTYAPGATYSANSAVTLYAVWELAYIPPKITNVIVERCDVDGNPTDEGTYVNVSFDWATDTARNVAGSSVDISSYDSEGNGLIYSSSAITDTSGHFSKQALGSGKMETEYGYDITIVVHDSHPGYSTVERSIMPIAYPIDILAEGKGVSFGCPATKPGVAEFKFDVEFSKGMIFGEEAKKCLLDFFYPVDSIYISHSDDPSKDPNVMFGGTWVRIQDRFLFGTDPNGTYNVGDEDGYSQHYLTVDELPPHQHTLLNENASGQTVTWTPKSVQYSDAGGWTGNVNTAYSGGGKPHNNMPPFVAVAIWRRTA